MSNERNKSNRSNTYMARSIPGHKSCLKHKLQFDSTVFNATKILFEQKEKEKKKRMCVVAGKRHSSLPASKISAHFLPVQ